MYLKSFLATSAKLYMSLAQSSYTHKIDFAQLKSEMQLVEKNDLALMEAENGRLMTEVDKPKQ